jgi:hypothetical protein
MDSLHRSKHLWCLKRCKEASIDRKECLLMDSLHRSKHLWCLKRCKEASIDRSQDKQKGAKGLATPLVLKRDN